MLLPGERRSDMQTLTTYHPLPSYDDIWGRRAERSTTNERPAWVTKAMAWMRAEYYRSTQSWVTRFETPETRQQYA
jgi:hypothetical protein